MYLKQKPQIQLTTLMNTGISDVRYTIITVSRYT